MSQYVPVPMLDLKAQFATIKDELMPAVNQVFEDQWFIMGPWVTKFQDEVADYLKVKHAIGVSSGTDALLLSLMALGVGPGDGVITTPFTFFATAGSIVRLGAVPIFVDIDPGTLNMDTGKLEEVMASGDLPAKPKVIIPVHIFGQPVRMKPVWDLARAHGLKIVEDAAQAIGAVYPGPGGGDTAFAGGLGDTGCFSFFPSKNLGAAGDGGLITTNDSELADKIISMRNHGATGGEKYLNQWVGGNFRLDALQACVLSTKLPHLAAWSEARRANAAEYAKPLLKRVWWIRAR
jgi:dTDP-4-amino-4,6-dideoxygalactose transaminase